MNNLQSVKLGELLISLKTGLNPRDNFKLNTPDAENWYITVRELNGLGVDFLTQTDRVNDHGLKLINNRSNLEVGDVLFSGTGTIGKTAIIDRKPSNWNIKEGVYSLKPKKDKLESYYLMYFLRHLNKLNVFSKISAGSTVFSVPMKNLEDLSIQIHKLPEQVKISNVLKSLDLKLELNNRMNAELEAMAKTLYNYWFVQFDFPDKYRKPYKSSGGKMVWNEELKREIPVGWEVKLLSDWIEKDKSGDWGKESEEGNYTERVHCIRGADINGLNGKGEVKSPVRYILPKNSHKILEPFDLIIEISGGSPTQSTGRLAFLIEETISRFDAPVICSNFCKAVTLKYQKSLFNFVFEWNNAYDNGVLFGFEGKTSGIKNLLFESFVTSYKTAVPPLKLMEDFFQNVYFLELKKQKLLKENNELAALRDWLLPMLMNGQVKVN